MMRLDPLPDTRCLEGSLPTFSEFAYPWGTIQEVWVRALDPAFLTRSKMPRPESAASGMLMHPPQWPAGAKIHPLAS